MSYLTKENIELKMSMLEEVEDEDMEGIFDIFRLLADAE